MNTGTGGSIVNCLVSEGRVAALSNDTLQTHKLSHLRVFMVLVRYLVHVYPKCLQIFALGHRCTFLVHIYSVFFKNCSEFSSGIDSSVNLQNTKKGDNLKILKHFMVYYFTYTLYIMNSRTSQTSSVSVYEIFKNKFVVSYDLVWTLINISTVNSLIDSYKYKHIILHTPLC